MKFKGWTTKKLFEHQYATSIGATIAKEVLSSRLSTNDLVVRQNPEGTYFIANIYRKKLYRYYHQY